MLSMELPGEAWEDEMKNRSRYDAFQCTWQWTFQVPALGARRLRRAEGRFVRRKGSGTRHGLRLALLDWPPTQRLKIAQ